MKRLVTTVVAATTLAAPLTVATAPVASACAEGSCSTNRITYSFYTNSGHLDFAYMRSDGGTYSRTNRRFTTETRPGSGIYRFVRTITVTNSNFIPASELSTDEEANNSWV